MSWFDEFESWLEYSITKDIAYCLHCYLFSSSAVKGKSKIEYRCRLNASIVCLHYLLMQGLAFRGNNESEESLNQGNFIELLKVLVSCNEEINNVVLKNAPENLKLIVPTIKKDIINACAVEITNVIIRDLEDDLFSILVDECRDVSVKEQMGVVIRYFNEFGCVVERFFSIVHSLFSTHGLSVSSLRGQGYDGVSNMRGEFNGLKSLILREISSVYYVHTFFNTVAHLYNVVRGSCKRRDMLREKQREKDQDIVNAMQLVKVSKYHLQIVRDDGWEFSLLEVVQFCGKYNIVVSEIDDLYTMRGRSRRRTEKIINLHFYLNINLLLCMAFLDPKNSFSTFDVSKLIELAKFYPCEFSPVALLKLESQLENFVFDMRMDKKFSDVKETGALVENIIVTRKHNIFFLVYMLVKLSLLLPVTTATIERIFSTMHIIKNMLRNKMKNDLLNDCLITYIKRHVFVNIDNQDIMNRFQAMKIR
ncbi:hypothetical protein MANES_18G139666v8 [Manihot esculenta]|uniref:Uncharacterized protein n=1 Tax=Manihot esculenta TaxID=3983 RepID=A0ACB7G1S2_MANES|nr:hypothetical protein MANES_18G139666v8 [Manihot esculenta]